MILSPPQDVKQLQQFLGMVNFYRRFLPGIARTLQPLTDALKGAPKMLEWPPVAAGWRLQYSGNSHLQSAPGF